MASSSNSDSLYAPNLQLAPLRSLDDFALGSARFQLPNLKDIEKWGNRVIKNLMYYQTNYFLMFLGIYVVMILVNPLKIICGLVVQAMLLMILMLFFGRSHAKIGIFASRMATAAGAESASTNQQKWYFLAGGLLIGYILLHLFSAVVLSIFTLLLPISLTFIHASLRLRNIKNKVANTMESFGPSTPMGLFLDALNITADSI